MFTQPCIWLSHDIKYIQIPNLTSKKNLVEAFKAGGGS